MTFDPSHLKKDTISARGCDASKELDMIYLSDAIERLERMLIDAR